VSRLRLGLVTPAFNQCQFLADTVDSVLGQGLGDRLDYLVINDGSTDATEDVLRRYGRRLRWRSQDNAGQTPTINAGWRDVGGDVVGWLNSDDTLLPGAASEALDFLDARPDVDIVYGRTVYTDAGGNRTADAPRGEPFRYATFVARCHNPIPQPSAFIRRRVLEHVGLLDEAFYYFMDWDYWLRAGLGHRIEHVPAVWSTYRLHPQSKTVAGELRAAPELAYAYQKFFARQDLPSDIARLRRRAMAAMYFTMGGYRQRGGDPKGARRDALQAVCKFPATLATGFGARAFAYCTAGETAPYRAWRQRRQPRPQSASLP
jgi:glycosyltransferase involved in cell wall biosynthesis